MSAFSPQSQSSGSGRIRLTDFEAWFLARQRVGKPDPVDGAPISLELAMLLRGLDLKNPRDFEHLLQQIGSEGIAQVFQQDPNSAEPTTTQTAKSAVIRASQLKNLALPEYALEGYPIYRTGFNALVGPGGGGKTFVALDIAARLAAELPDGFSVAYMAYEGVHGFSPRYEAWLAHNGYSDVNLLFYMEPTNFMQRDDVDELARELRPHQPVFVIIDTVARSMVGADENSTRDMGVYIASIDNLCHRLDCGVLLVHHTNKNGIMRGNNSLYNACDSVLFLKRTDTQIALHNSYDEGGKNKHRAEAETRYLRLLPKQVNINGADVQAAVLVDAQQIITDSPESELEGHQQTILEALDGFPNGLNAKGIQDATQISRATIYRKLKDLLERKFVIQNQEDRYEITQEGRDALLG